MTIETIKKVNRLCLLSYNGKDVKRKNHEKLLKELGIVVEFDVEKNEATLSFPESIEVNSIKAWCGCLLLELTMI